MTEAGPNRREEILQAALEVFAENGYEKASIKLIARRAGLKSPALIYWYFENKEELLKAVISMVSPIIAQSAEPAVFLELPLEQALVRFGVMLLSTFNHPKTGMLFRVFLSEALRSQDTVPHIADSGPRLMLDLLLTYLQRQVEQGRIRQCSPEAVARAFIGALMIYFMGKEVLTPLGEGFPPPEAYVQEVVHVFINGLSV